MSTWRGTSPPRTLWTSSRKFRTNTGDIIIGMSARYSCYLLSGIVIADERCSWPMYTRVTTWTGGFTPRLTANRHRFVEELFKFTKIRLLFTGFASKTLIGQVSLCSKFLLRPSDPYRETPEKICLEKVIKWHGLTLNIYSRLIMTILNC